MDIMQILLYVFAVGGVLLAAFFYQKQMQFNGYFTVLSKGGVLVVIKSLGGARLFVAGARHGNSIHTKIYGAYQLTGTPGEIERFYGVNAIFAHESCASKPTEQACMALAVLDAAVNDPANSSIVQKATFQAGNVTSNAILEDSIQAYNRQILD